MSEKAKDQVRELLENYSYRERQIKVLRYDLAHHSDVSEEDTIKALALSHGEGGGHSTGHVSNKTLYIALNYQGQVERENTAARAEIVTQLVSLERTQERLKYFVSLLNKRQSSVIELTCFEGYTQEEAAKQLGISKRTLQTIKAQAIEALAAMYDFTQEVD